MARITRTRSIPQPAGVARGEEALTNAAGAARAEQRGGALPSLIEDTDAEANDPSIPSAEYERMRPRWEKCRACMIGTEAIRAGGTLYLPRYAQEGDTRYNVRRVIAAFYNGYARTVLASVGMLLEDDPTLGDDMDQQLVDLTENIDAAGSHLTVFARRVASAGMVDGSAGILVEHGRPDDPNLNRSRASAAAEVPGAQLSSADEAALGLRPYWILFRADDVFQALYAPINGVRTLVLLVLREVVKVRRGKFGRATITQYRCYFNLGEGVISYELWRAPITTGGAQDGRPVRVEGPNLLVNQTEIPWAPFIPGEELAAGDYKPPLIDLADLNIQYHNTLTNILSLQSLAFVPTPVRLGAKPDEDGKFPELILGPGNTIEAPVMEGIQRPVYWLSPEISVLAPGQETLIATKADMGAMGAAFLSEETRAAETAEGKRIDSAASRATLANTAQTLKDTLERAYGFTGNYLQVQAGSVTLNEDFTGTEINPQYLAVLVQAYQEDVLTLEELRHVIQTGTLPEDFDAGDTLQLIAKSLAEQDAAREAQAAMVAAQSSGASLPITPPSDSRAEAA